MLNIVNDRSILFIYHKQHMRSSLIKAQAPVRTLSVETTELDIENSQREKTRERASLWA